MNKRQIKIEIQEIEKQLDKSAPWEDPPYRYARQKLQRRRTALFCALKGKDARYKVIGEICARRGLTSRERRLVGERRRVNEILDILK